MPPMGTFHVAIEVGDPQAQQWQRVEALVDTGASFTWVPTDTLQQLGIHPQARWEFEIADGTVIEHDVADTMVRLGGETRPTTVVFGDVGSQALLGAFTLEGFRLAPDPVNRRLVRVRPLAMNGMVPVCDPSHSRDSLRKSKAPSSPGATYSP